jgi:hypothetical protein
MAVAPPAPSDCQWQPVGEHSFRCRRCKVLLHIKDGDAEGHLARQPACGSRYHRVLHAELVAQRRAICRACEDWDDELHGCRLLVEFERERLTRYKQQSGHCCRGCFGETPKW